MLSIYERPSSGSSTNDGVAAVGDHSVVVLLRAPVLRNPSNRFKTRQTRSPAVTAIPAPDKRGAAPKGQGGVRHAAATTSQPFPAMPGAKSRRSESAAEIGFGRQMNEQNAGGAADRAGAMTAAADVVGQEEVACAAALFAAVAGFDLERTRKHNK